MSERSYSLDIVQVATPCHEDWDTMQGDDRKRFCDHCEKYVHNLSAMTRDEAQAFVDANPTDICIRMYHDAEGHVLTANPLTGTTTIRQTRRRAAMTWLPWLGGLVGCASAVLIWFGIIQRQPAPCVVGMMAPAPNHQQLPPPTMGQPVPPNISIGGAALMGDIAQPQVKPRPPQLQLEQERSSDKAD